MKNRLIRDFCIENSLLKEGDKVLLGLSGGADSVCLLFSLLEMREEFGLTLTAMHVHHGIRGAEADRDESFCEALCRRVKVPFTVVHLDVPEMVRTTGDSLEEAARKARYNAFSEFVSENGYDKIAVAHHKNDQAETVLFQMVRGSRISGLAGIKAGNGQVIRPLLCMSRQDIEGYLAELGEEYVTDSTNNADDASRNVLRHTVMPALNEIQSAACDHICEVATYMSRVDDFLEQETEKLRIQAVSREGDRVYVNIEKLSESHSVIAERLVYDVICELAGRKKDITHLHVESALKLMDASTGAKVCLKYGIVAEKAFESLVFTDKNKIDNIGPNCNNCTQTPPSIEVVLYERKDGESTESFVKRAGGFGDGRTRKVFDAEMLRQVHPTGDRPVMRYAKQTDAMAVYADGRRKKVFDLLMEAKIMQEDRGRQTVAAADDEVLMIYGLRGSENYRISDDTQLILAVEFREE